jgi:hypothetical protein
LPQIKNGKLPFCSWHGGTVRLTEKNRLAKEENIRKAKERADMYRAEERRGRRMP